MNLLEMIVEKIVLKNKRFIDAMKEVNQLTEEVDELRREVINLNDNIDRFVKAAQMQLNANLEDLQSLHENSGGIDISLPQSRIKKDTEKPN